MFWPIDQCVKYFQRITEYTLFSNQWQVSICKRETIKILWLWNLEIMQLSAFNHLMWRSDGYLHKKLRNKFTWWGADDKNVRQHIFCPTNQLSIKVWTMQWPAFLENDEPMEVSSSLCYAPLNIKDWRLLWTRICWGIFCEFYYFTINCCCFVIPIL